MAERKFPDGFLWGAATAAFQVEGGIENTDWAKAAREGKVPPCGVACDHYNRYESDFDIAKDLGHNCHRISIEWARIEPEEGKWDEKEVEHYKKVIEALRARHLKPLITLWHFTLPNWFADKGGFEHPDAPQIFARYCGYIAQKFGNDCRHFATMNEPTVYVSNGWRRGSWPPFQRWPGIEHLRTVPGHREDPALSGRWRNVGRYFYVMRQIVRAHNAAYDAMKAAGFGLEVGIVHQVILFHANGNPFNKLLAVFMNWHWTHSFLKRVYRKCDSIGVNYYLHKKFGDTRVYEKTDMGWDVYPEGLCDALLMLRRYVKPLWVSEAGIADESDRLRADYIKRLVRCMHVAIEKGADVRGYMYWSLLDNYEWAHGFDKRFGLIAVDFDTQKRTMRPSARAYADIIARNAL